MLNIYVLPDKIGDLYFKNLTALQMQNQDILVGDVLTSGSGEPLLWVCLSSENGTPLFSIHRDCGEVDYVRCDFISIKQCYENIVLMLDSYERLKHGRFDPVDDVDCDICYERRVELNKATESYLKSILHEKVMKEFNGFDENTRSEILQGVFKAAAKVLCDFCIPYSPTVIKVGQKNIFVNIPYEEE